MAAYRLFFFYRARLRLPRQTIIILMSDVPDRQQYRYLYYYIYSTYAYWIYFYYRYCCTGIKNILANIAQRGTQRISTGTGTVEDGVVLYIQYV